MIVRIHSRAGQNLNTERRHLLARSPLVCHETSEIGVRADKGNTVLRALFGECRRFRQKAISGMNSVCSAIYGYIDYGTSI